MRLDSIEVQNFFDHKYTSVNLADIPSPILIKGENGAGKSSFFVDALTFAIFGETRMPSPDQAIRTGMNEMGVGVKFNLNGQDVEIMRTKKRGKSAKLELIVDGIRREELLSETQKRLDKMFGLSYNSFLSSIILKQDEADFFCRQKPDDRKKIIGEILDLGQYDQLEKIARERRANLKNEMKAEEGVYNSIEIKDESELSSQLATLNKGYDKLSLEVSTLEAQLETLVAKNAAFEKQQEMAENAQRHNRKIKDNIEILTSKINDAQKKLEQSQKIMGKEIDHTDIVAKADAAIKSLYNTREDIASAYTKIKLQYERANSEAKKITEKIKHLESGIFEICPTCKQNVDVSHVRAMVSELTQQRDTLKEEMLSLSPNESKVVDEIEKLSVQIEKAEHFRSEKIAEQQKYHLAVQLSQTLEEQIKQFNEMRDDLNTQFVEVPKLLLKKQDEMPTRLSLQTKKDHKDQAARLINTIEHSIEQNNASIERKKILETEISKKNHMINLLDKLCYAFSNKGIPAAIIETVLPEIEDTTNYFLSRLSQGRLLIHFVTSETMKNGNEKETLEVEVYDGKEWRRFETFSGGEQFRISLSIRLSLSKVLSRRANVDLQLLILDEAATSLDEQGREEFIQTILSLKQDFSRILLMSHIPNLASEFDNSITFIKSMDGTKVLKD